MYLYVRATEDHLVGNVFGGVYPGINSVASISFRGPNCKTNIQKEFVLTHHQRIGGGSEQKRTVENVNFFDLKFGGKNKHEPKPNEEITSKYGESETGINLDNEGFERLWRKSFSHKKNN